MKVQLITHSFPDDSNWIVVNPSVPIGTLYEVLDYIPKGFIITNFDSYKTREVPVYYLVGNNDRGFMPACLFKVIES